MGTRTGSLDPGVVLYLIGELGMDARAIERLLYRESGLLGVSGISSDMSPLEARDAPDAKAAIDLYVYRLERELGSLAAALAGLDAIVFTAGIGDGALMSVTGPTSHCGAGLASSKSPAPSAGQLTAGRASCAD